MGRGSELDTVYCRIRGEGRHFNDPMYPVAKQFAGGIPNKQKHKKCLNTTPPPKIKRNTKQVNEPLDPTATPSTANQVRLLRAESEQVKQQNSELKMKTQVELESLQEQLRVRKEKQYQLLEKLQGQEEAKRQAEDQVRLGGWEGDRSFVFSFISVGGGCDITYLVKRKRHSGGLSLYSNAEASRTWFEVLRG